jgi:1-aminocyclopropane-1-carboxylate deaminase/D-cysteine desulfhydrase-like pyridoxal-dependent ACC family enzyme
LLDVLRLDELHPVVSGNKWFKLKYYLEDALATGCHTVLTYGGAWSNHIVAVAFACREYGLKNIGVIRGQQPTQMSVTLQRAAECGMELQFAERAQFTVLKKQLGAQGHIYHIPEGGYGLLGAKGAAEILQYVPNLSNYTHIACAVGTGTMFAGIINASLPGQRVIGISVLKNNFSIVDETRDLLTNSYKGDFVIEHGWHFGGYAKHTPQLIEFMKEAWHNYKLPTDIVYTSKTLYAVKQMVVSQAIPAGSRVLMVHSGGLQGNASLPAQVLPF